MVPETGIHSPIHLIPNVMDLPETPPNPSLGEPLQIKTLDMLPPSLLPNHHQVPKTQFPKLVVAILRCFYPSTDIGEGRIRVGQIVPMSLLSTPVVSIDKQPFVSGRSLFIGRMMVVALLRKGLR